MDLFNLAVQQIQAPSFYGQKADEQKIASLRVSAKGRKLTVEYI